MFLYKNLFFRYLFFQSQSCLLESTAAIFRQSVGYVFYSFNATIVYPGYFPAVNFRFLHVSVVCLIALKEKQLL